MPTILNMHRTAIRHDKPSVNRNLKLLLSDSKRPIVSNNKKKPKDIEKIATSTNGQNLGFPSSGITELTSGFLSVLSAAAAI